jgi:hypothetical protein
MHQNRLPTAGFPALDSACHRSGPIDRVLKTNDNSEAASESVDALDKRWKGNAGRLGLTHQRLILSHRKRSNEKGLRRALPQRRSPSSAHAIDRESLRVDGLFLNI